MRNQLRLLELQSEHGDIECSHHVPGESWYRFEDGHEVTFGERDKIETEEKRVGQKWQRVEK